MCFSCDGVRAALLGLREKHNSKRGRTQNALVVESDICYRVFRGQNSS